MATDDGDREPRGRDRALIALFGVAVAFVVVAPLARRGWVSLLDWVPGPRAVGSSVSAIPSGPLFAGPVHALHWMLGAAVGWVPLAIALALAAAGGALLIGGPWPARVATGVAYAWNPFVFDRIAAGQMSVLLGYALLPWLARAALRASTWQGAVIVGVWWAAAASCTVHYTWIGGLLVVSIGLVRVRELGVARVLGGLAVALVLAGAIVSTWVLLSRNSVPPRGNTQVLTSFATRSDPDLGRPLGLLAQQGFWRPVVKRPRDDLGSAFPFVAGASIAAALFGLVLTRGTRRARLAASVAIAGGVGWILAQGSAGAFGAGYRFLFEHLPAFGVMREAQKWAALICLAIAVGTGALAAAIARTRVSALAWLVVVIPVALAPTLAWGLDGRITPSHQPPSWAAVRTAVDRLHGDVAVLPFEQYPAPVITGDRTVANLGPSFFGSHAIASRDPGVAGVRGDEGRRAKIASAVRAAAAATATGQPPALGTALARLGLRGVLVIGPNSLPLERDPTLTRQTVGDGVSLWVVR